jgi:hypothetical protein
MKQWKAGDKVIKNNNTQPGIVVSQDGRKVTVKLDAGGKDDFNANDLKRRQ